MGTGGGELFFFYIDEANPRDMAADNIYLWLITSEGRLNKYSTEGALVDSITGLFSSGWGLTWENNRLWVSDPVSDSIYQVELPHQDITADSVKKWIDAGANLVILDVRESYEFESYGRIPGALNMPWNSGVLDTAYTQLSLDDTIVVVCQGGYRSEQASKFLDGKEFENVYNMFGGMNAWHHAVEVGGHISVNASWQMDKSPFIAAADIVVDNGKSLTLKPGVRVEFAGFFSFEVYGTLLAQGTIDSIIHFTSYGSFPNGWQGIRIVEGDGSLLNYCRIDSSQNSISCLNSSPTITNSWLAGNQNCLIISGPQANPSIQGCELDGRGGFSDILILCDSSSAPTIAYCNLTDGSKGVVAGNGANPKLSYNNIYNNGDYGILNQDSTLILDAQNNWWGDESGPFDPSGNPDGLGDQVSQWVDYTPWLRALVPYVCGDANTDSSVSVVDVVYLINYLFRGGPPPYPLDIGDVNCDESITLADIVFLINYMFRQGTLPCDCPLRQVSIAKQRSI
jgi:rhodanese-related sulfurtransferase